MAQPGLVLASCLALAAPAAGQQDPAYLPVNRYFSVEADRPRPDLECVVRTGLHWSQHCCVLHCCAGGRGLGRHQRALQGEV